MAMTTGATMEMTSLNPSAFDRLHPEIRRWIWDRKWQELREVQSGTISAVLDSKEDILVSAATAAGKTEAAFLPILTDIAENLGDGLSVLYVSPLKALINDQFLRLDELCERMEIETVRWHGDAPQSAKKRMLRKPNGIALITPESIEALFIRRPADARRLFSALQYVVVDELHSFLQGPRGLHLASLLRRIDEITDKRPRRIGLSATMGDLSMAASWLCSETPDKVIRIEATAGAPELRLQVRGYIDPAGPDPRDDLEEEGRAPRALDLIADHIFETLRGSNNLVFAGSRRRVEALSDRLRRRSERLKAPNEFFPHHGSLSKELREDLETRLKNGDLPTTAIATTTLELGIDLGSVKSVAQIGAPRSLSSLRQRLGRSGRRKDTPSILRIYLREKDIEPDTDPIDRLRFDALRAVAAVRLLVAKFVEPPGGNEAVATAVLHQTLSVITERGGERADKLYKTICGGGPLSDFEKSDYVELLRAMASADQRLIEQSPDGTIMLGEEGERLTRERDFYAIFQSDQEWRLITAGRTLGTIPLSNMLGEGSLVGFAGQRWRVESVDDRAKTLVVVPHRSGVIPIFDRLSMEPIHDRLAAEMRSVYLGEHVPAYLDETAASLLAEGRAAFREFSLETNPFLKAARDTHLFTWRGSAFNSVFAAALTSLDLECEVNDIAVTIAEADFDDVRRALRHLAVAPPTVALLAAHVGNLGDAKYDEYVPRALLERLWARHHKARCDEIGQLAAALATAP